MGKTYGIRSLMISSLVSLCMLVVGYFVIRHRLGLLALVICMVIIEIRFYASRYQVVRVNAGSIVFMSVDPFTKPKSVAVDKIKKIVSDHSLLVISTDAGEVNVPLSLHINERKILFENFAATGLQLETK